MGDRANVRVNGSVDGDYVHLYTHWGASELPRDLRDALARRVRWDDPQYLARIIFCQMIGDDTRSETGFGISHEVGDGAECTLVVETLLGTVSFGKKTWSMEKFASLTDEECAGVWDD